MKKIISATILASALASGMSMADSISSVKGQIEGIVSHYMEGLCQGDIDKMSEVYFAERIKLLGKRSKEVSEDCLKSGGLSHVKVHIDPSLFNSMYTVVGQVPVNVVVTYKNNVTQEGSAFVDNGTMNNTNKLTLYSPITF